MRWTKCLKCFDTINCSASVALVLSRVTIGLRVIIWLTGVECGSRPSAVTYEVVFSTWSTAGKGERKEAHPKRQILRGEDTTQPFVIVNDKNAVSTLCSAQLASLSD